MKEFIKALLLDKPWFYLVVCPLLLAALLWVVGWIMVIGFGFDL